MIRTIGNGVVHNGGYLAGAGTVFLGLNADTWGIIGVVVGMTFMALTYATNLYFKIKHTR